MNAAPLRILVVADLYYPPTVMGGPITASRWAERLAARGHEVTVLAAADGLRGSVETDRGPRVLRIPALPAPHPRPEVRAQMRLLPLWPRRAVRRALAVARPQVVHLHFMTPLGVAALAVVRRAGLPILATNHALPEAALYFYGRDRAEAVRARAPAVYAAAERAIRGLIVRFYNASHAMTAPTAAAIALYRAWGVSVPTYQVSNGIDLARFAGPPPPGERSRLLARLGIPADRRVVLYAGRMNPEKRVEVLLAGFARVPAAARAHLLLVGGRDAQVERRIATLGIADRVTVAGILGEDELTAAYRGAYLLANASECEAQGIVFLEAMAAGLPVVAVDRYAVRETVVPGETGLLVAPGDDVALGAAIERLIGDPALARRLGDLGRRRAARHDLEPSVDAIERLLRSLAVGTSG